MEKLPYTIPIFELCEHNPEADESFLQEFLL